MSPEKFGSALVSSTTAASGCPAAGAEAAAPHASSAGQRANGERGGKGSAGTTDRGVLLLTRGNNPLPAAAACEGLRTSKKGITRACAVAGQQAQPRAALPSADPSWRPHGRRSSPPTAPSSCAARPPAPRPVAATSPCWRSSRLATAIPTPRRCPLRPPSLSAGRGADQPSVAIRRSHTANPPAMTASRPCEIRASRERRMAAGGGGGG